jgi:3'(2'), 5'-bisphosphate nucleotidase
MAVAQAAGRLQCAYRERGTAVITKADASPVTAADRDTEALLLEALARLAPNVPIVAEEAIAAGHRPAVGTVAFLVDPLDGTREFIAGRPEFTVNVACVVEGVPTFGLVYAPACHDLYVTIGPSPMRVPLAPDADPNSVTLSPIHVRTPDPDALTALVSASHPSPGTDDILARYAIAERRAAGSSLKFCRIAAGEGDIYPRVGPTSAWDTAAGQAILEAAGGSVTTLDGAPLRYTELRTSTCNPDFIAWGVPAPGLPPRHGTVRTRFSAS